MPPRTGPAPVGGPRYGLETGGRGAAGPSRSFGSSPPGDVVGPSGDRAPRPSGRFLTALIAWPPIGLGAALLYGELTGCARFSVACADATSPWPWIIQLATIALFLLVPMAARIAVYGTYAMLIVVTPLTLFLVTGGRAGSDLAPRLLVAGLALAWVAGVLVAVSRRRRRSDEPGPTGAPPRTMTR